MSRKKLPTPDAPLTLPDGTTVAPAAQPYSMVEIPSNSEAQRLVATTRRKLIDMPALPKQMNSYAVVLCYTASGLTDAEIAVATRLTEQQVRDLRNQPAYAQLESMVIEAVKEQAATAVRDILVNAERSAAERMSDLVASNSDKIAFAAAREVLHMGGYKAPDKVDVRHQMMNTFRIEVVDKRDSNNMPVIDLTAEEA